MITAILQAKVIGTDPNTDLALIKISATQPAYRKIRQLGRCKSRRVGIGSW